MNKIDILGFKIESFDSESFVEDVVSFKPNSLILGYDTDKVFVKHKPGNINLRKELFKFIRLKEPRLNYFLYPVVFIIDSCRLFLFFLVLFLKFKVKVVVSENTYAVFLIGILRRLKFIPQLIYVSGDWLAGHNTKRGIWSFLGNEVVFPLFDYCACKLSDKTVEFTELIKNARRVYWGRQIARKEIVYSPRLKLMATDDSRKRTGIAFIGNIRPDSGFELIFGLMKELRDSFDARLSLIGPDSENLRRLLKSSRFEGLAGFIDFHGFLDRDEFNNALMDCFCGVNLITSRTSYSSMTVPAKICDYLQYLLPPLVTPNLGYYAHIISENQLGLVVEPLKDEITKGLVSLYKEQHIYRKIIIDYIKANSRSLVKDYLEA